MSIIQCAEGKDESAKNSVSGQWSRKMTGRDAWVARLVKRPTLDFCSDHDFRTESYIRRCAQQG